MNVNACVCACTLCLNACVCACTLCLNACVCACTLCLNACVCVHIVFAEFNSGDHWGSGLCVYMAEVPRTNVVGISSKNLGMCPGEQKRLHFDKLCFHSSRQNMCFQSAQNTVFFVLLCFYNAVRIQCSLSCVLCYKCTFPPIPSSCLQREAPKVSRCNVPISLTPQRFSWQSKVSFTSVIFPWLLLLALLQSW